jgi:hypothetical protein
MIHGNANANRVDMILAVASGTFSGTVTHNANAPVTFGETSYYEFADNLDSILSSAYSAGMFADTNIAHTAGLKSVGITDNYSIFGNFGGNTEARVGLVNAGHALSGIGTPCGKGWLALQRSSTTNGAVYQYNGTWSTRASRSNLTTTGAILEATKPSLGRTQTGSYAPGNYYSGGIFSAVSASVLEDAVMYFEAYYLAKGITPWV